MKAQHLMKLIATCLAMAWTLGIQAQGIIWTVNLSSTGGNGAGAGPIPNREIAIDHVSDPFFSTPPSLNPVSGIFAMTISTNDAGRTFFANALNQPGFAGLTVGLTDGANDYLRVSEYFFSTWKFGSEANFLGRSLAAPDFAGYEITQVGFRINNYYDWFYEPENRYLNTLDYSLDFYAVPVPEPGTWTLVGLGGAAALLLRRTRPKRPTSR
jgi:hypothetical protein